VDAVSSLLKGPRAQGAFLLRSSMDPPWCLRIEDRAPLTVAAVVRGSAHVAVDPDAGGADAHGAAGMWLGAGDVMLARGPTPYVVADHPDTAPQVIIGPGQVCTNVDGSDAFGLFEQSVRSWGNAAEGATLLVTGTYEHASQVSLRLLSALPVLSAVRRDDWENPVLDLLVAEVVKDTPGQAAILDRLLDLLCLTTVRACLTRPGATAPSWYTASADPVVGPALELIHNNPAHPWTVASLGAAVGASRAAFARRFTDLVGEPPLTYLTKWRLDVAADELQDPSVTVARVARDVGYENPFAFSNAFKRHTGLSPSEHRNLMAAREVPAQAH
jgi:AraC-like DNA-binding protein